MELTNLCALLAPQDEGGQVAPSVLIRHQDNQPQSTTLQSLRSMTGACVSPSTQAAAAAHSIIALVCVIGATVAVSLCTCFSGCSCQRAYVQRCLLCPCPMSAALLAKTPGILTVCDTNGRVLYQNPAAVAYAGPRADASPASTHPSYLEELFALEPELLQEVRDAVGAGGAGDAEWCGEGVRVPSTLARAPAAATQPGPPSLSFCGPRSTVANGGAGDHAGGGGGLLDTLGPGLMSLWDSMLTGHVAPSSRPDEQRTQTSTDPSIPDSLTSRGVAGFLENNGVVAGLVRRRSIDAPGAAGRPAGPGNGAQRETVEQKPKAAKKSMLSTCPEPIFVPVEPLAIDTATDISEDGLQSGEHIERGVKASSCLFASQE